MESHPRQLDGQKSSCDNREVKLAEKHVRGSESELPSERILDIMNPQFINTTLVLLVIFSFYSSGPTTMPTYSRLLLLLRQSG